MNPRLALLRVIGLIVVSLLPLILLTGLVMIPASAHEKSSAYTSETGTASVQGTPTVDLTVTALAKEKLNQEVKQLQNENSLSWNSVSWTTLGSIGSIGTILVGLIVAQINLLQWFRSRKDEQKKRSEERFQTVVTGLGSKDIETKVGAAIMLRTFLHPDYEQFHKQVFDLAVSYLRLRKANGNTSSHPSLSIELFVREKDANMLPDSLSQALIMVFKASFPLARDEIIKQNSRASIPFKDVLPQDVSGNLQSKEGTHFEPQSLDASGVRLDKAYLVRTDLRWAWMQNASLQEADLTEAKLRGADLTEAELRGATLTKADLTEAKLLKAKLLKAKLLKAKLSKTQLMEANLTEADFRGSETNLTEAQLVKANLTKAMLTDANLTRANLTSANLTNALLSGANLTGAILTGATLIGADLTAANLTNTTFTQADLTDADLSWAQFTGIANPGTARSLTNTRMIGVIDLSPEERLACERKHAIFKDADT